MTDGHRHGSGVAGLAAITNAVAALAGDGVTTPSGSPPARARPLLDVDLEKPMTSGRW
jgi:hypothetical protein